MAIPTTQKECTTRRIAALIIGLWDKVKNAFLLKTSRGTANGVASLDANGKVPSSQLPKIGTSGIADDAITAALVKDNELLPVNIAGWSSGMRATQLSNSNNYIRVAKITFTLRDDSAAGISGRIFYRGQWVSTSGELLFAISFRDYSSNDIKGKLYVLNDRGSIPDIAIGVVPISDTEYDVWLYAIRPATSTTSVVFEQTRFCSIEMKNDSGQNTAPSGYEQIASSGRLVTVTKQVGSASIPVYIDASGQPQQATNIPVIEHVTSIPVSPTVGTIYAL